MRFGQTIVARTSQAHRADPLRMGPFNASSMAIGVFEYLRALSASCSEKCLHPLWWLQGQGTPSRAGTGGSIGTRLTIRLGELHPDNGFPFGILRRRPA